MAYLCCCLALLGVANFGELRFGEVRVLGFLRSSLSAYRASTGQGYPSGHPGPSKANILRRGGRPAEVRHVPDNSGVSGLGVDNLALDALPTVSSSRPTGCRCTIALAGALVRVSGAGCLQT